jgi:hypothetical protein
MASFCIWSIADSREPHAHDAVGAELVGFRFHPRHRQLAGRVQHETPFRLQDGVEGRGERDPAEDVVINQANGQRSCPANRPSWWRPKSR